MGFYLNGTSAYGLFQEEIESTYFVDKSEILYEFVPIFKSRGKEKDEKGKNIKYSSAQINFPLKIMLALRSTSN